MRMQARTPRARRHVLALMLTGLAFSTANAQSHRFTVDDLLDLANVNIADVTADGRYALVTTAALRDRLGIDNARYGDPSYTAPALGTAWVVATATGKAQKLFPEKRQVRGFSWSPDGTKLAFSALRNGRFEPMVWERSTARTRALKLPADRVLADGQMQWSGDGTSLLVPLRAADWPSRAQEGFVALTSKPIIVQSSKEPFLAWDALARLRLEQSLALYDVASGQVRAVVPQTLIRSFNLSEDGSFITYEQDITTKTDYDVIRGSDNQLMLQSTAGGEPRKLIASTKGLNLLWSQDGRRYAYSKDGAVFFGAVDSSEPRKLFGPAPRQPADSARAPADTA
ncbi:MAG TPA: hypothetical protein VK864_04255, partial [Longimicrobiales bacterium]|nr:hypothetical protein [Longimicrobiales bacterium]